MAESKQCRQCKGTFLYLTNDQLCLSCSQNNELEFKRIKAYLQQYPGASIGTIATVLDISVSNIQKYIDEGRLDIIEKKQQ